MTSEREIGRVWVVDDSPLETELARRALVSEHAVETFVDGASALEHLATHGPPDAMVLDWQMPGMSGIEVCQFLRARKETASLPVLMLTMHDQTPELVQGLAAGADDFLTKPFEAAELKARVRTLIRAKRTLDKLQRAERTVRALLRHLPEAVLTYDLDGRVTFANREAERMLERPERDVLGLHAEQLFPELPWSEIVAHRQADLFTLPDVKRNGRVLAPVVRVLASSDLNDTAISFRDVTRQRQIEESRLDLYSVVAHDLRGPLWTLILRTELMMAGKRGPVSPELSAELGKMKLQLNDLASMVTDFLDLARLDASEVRLVRAPVDLREVVAQVAADFDLLAERKRVKVDVERYPAPLIVSGDRRRLVQVVTNLLSNAIHFSPENAQLAVRFAATPDEIEVRFIDHGPGIAADDLPRLFKRFGRAVDAQRTATGTGLGLMIVKQLVESHGGRVSVTSTVGQGSTFAFALPAVASGIAAGRSGTGEGRARAPRTVLLVDDDEELREMTAYQLIDRGHRVLHAQNGRGALELLSRMDPKPDVVLLDITMPVMSGTELLAVLASDGVTPALPVVVVSSQAVEAQTARRVLRKPVPIETLLRVVDEVSGPTAD